MNYLYIIIVMTKLITIILSYYNQNDFLKYHLNIWNEYPEHIRDKFTFFIMDDCSKENANDVLKNIDLKNLDLHIYRSKKDIYCNISGVRNLGAQQCQTDWLVLLDMDTIINLDLAESLLKLAFETNNNTTFKFNRKVINDSDHPKNNKVHPAVCLIRKKDYWDVGGCEEDLVGHYGWTDPSFWHKARGKVKVEECKKIYLIYHSDGEADIKRDHGHNRKVFKDKMRTNSWSKDYIRFKWEKIK